MTNSDRYADRKLYYIHGYQSNPDSTKGLLLKKELNVTPIKYRDCAPEELVISEAINRIKEQIKNDENVVLIGSSLGGLLAAKTALHVENIKQLILLNPAIVPISQDISKITDMPRHILLDMQDEKLFTTKIKPKINILLGTMDDTVPNWWVVEFAKAQQATILFLHDDHSFTQNMQKLPDIIRNLLEEKH